MIELSERQENILLIAGVDEAGRGPWAGPVVAAAVILNPKRAIRGLKDSKLLNELQREKLYQRICEHALCYSIASASVEEIDSINILQASLLAMKRAVSQLTIQAHKILVDGNKSPDFGIPSEAIIGGDNKIAAISAASILAKVTRDRIMVELDGHYPHYGFAKHKGYGTPMHQQSLAQYGICEHHRKSFKPIKAWDQA